MHSKNVNLFLFHFFCLNLNHIFFRFILLYWFLVETVHEKDNAEFQQRIDNEAATDERNDERERFVPEKHAQHTEREQYGRKDVQACMYLHTALVGSEQCVELCQTD